MDHYIGTKQVSAMCIAIIEASPGGGMSALFGHVPDTVVEVDAEWMQRHNPREGGYFVQYEDGYTSYSPAAAFEKAYKLIQAASSPEASLSFEFKVGDAVTVFDRYRLGARDVSAVVIKLSGRNDGVMVDIHPDFKFLLGGLAGTEYWVRPQQLRHVKPKTGNPPDSALHIFAREGLKFGDVITGIKAGKSFSRKGWNGKGMYITGQFPDEHSKMTRPYIYMVCPPGSTRQYGENHDKSELVPWLASQTDMMAEDWVLI